MKILLKQAIVYPITSQKFQGDVLVIGERIAEVKPSIQPTQDMTVIDARALHLLPGFIDVHTHLGLYDEGTGWAGNDANETSEVSTPHIRSLDGIHPLDIAFQDAVQNGITTVHVMPGSQNIIGGTTCVIKTAGTCIDHMIIQEPAGLKIAFGENPKKVHSNGTKESITRMGIMGLLRESFYEAQHYGHEADFRMLSILKALRREIPVRIHAHRADDISSALRFAKEFNLDLRLEHCTEGHFIVEELSKHNLKVSVGPTLTRRSKIELKNKTWDTYHILSKNGVEVSITTDHPYTPIQYLNVCAAVAVREGLDEKTALEGITIFPARNLRLEDRIGSIEVGKDADLVLWTHHPFHYLAKPVLTMIDGKIIYKKNKKN
ncbi:TPA: amidohydrolase [Bacillus anthracis]|uniref:Amidohydrolase n=2 Tax=Bacillus cereus group TaxID=86661 RepID=A0A2B0YCG9_BACAN|nr:MULTISPECIES: amidohydrolase [Bacillus cereus group]KZD39968.1 Metallo-dependent hydrolase subgroup C [Bacillus cereus]MCU5341529.1 amidohydrolase [Bacillus cereus]PFL74001.1 amidohydrolase [Bacillus anthracis]HDR7433046.1 amidohydrolase [Bacillus anthracis]